MVRLRVYAYIHMYTHTYTWSDSMCQQMLCIEIIAANCLMVMT